MKTLLSTLSILFLSSSFALSVSAQSLTAERNAYRAGDNLIKQQVEYRDAGSSGRNLVWDFRFLQPIDDEYAVKYSTPRGRDTTEICGLEHRTRYYYSQRSDSVFAVGFENSTTLMQYSTPELRMRFPFAYGDTLFSQFEGRGEYSRRLPLHVKGFTRTQADAEGELILPDATVKRALRVHSQRVYTEFGKDSVEMLLDTYYWYAAGSRYPVFESVKTTVIGRDAQLHVSTEDGGEVFTTSFYYPPEQQITQTGEDRNTDVETDNYPSLQTAADIFTEATYNPNPVISTLTINYTLTRSAQIRFSLHNNWGMPAVQTTVQNQTEGVHSAQINMGGLLSGVYTLYVFVDNMVMSVNIIKN